MNGDRSHGGMPRRQALARLAALGAGALLPGCAANETAPASRLERNKAVALSFKKAQGTPEEADVMHEVLAPGYKRWRGGMENLAANARGQSFPGGGSFLRGAFPDRVDIIEDVIADGDRVGLRFRLTGTHRGNLFGIAPTGRKVDVYEVAILRVVDGRITEGWFMADEAGILKQLGAELPPRKDGKRVAPPITDAGEDGDALLARLKARPAVTREDRNKLVVAASKTSAPPKDTRASGYKQLRQGLQHMRNYGIAKGTVKFTPTYAFPDRRDHILGLLAEGDTVWMQFNLRGTHTRSFYGLPPTDRRVEMPEIGIARFVDGKWAEGWYFGDELGILLQLGALHMLRG